MQKLINFKKNIFEKRKTEPYGPQYSLQESLAKIIKIKKDLAIIKKDFGNYSTREVILIHASHLPPKTKRCLISILKIDDSMTHSTNQFMFNENNEAILEIIINLQKNKMDTYISYVDKIIRLFEIINNKDNSKGVQILKDKVIEYPTWLRTYFKKNKLKKMQTIEFISEIQQYYSSLHFLDNEVNSFEGDFIFSFSSIETKNEFIKNNKLSNFKALSDEKKIIANGNQIVDKTNILNFAKRQKIEKIIDKKEITSSNLYAFDKPSSKSPTIGVLDTKINDRSYLKNYIKVTSMTNNKKSDWHGEAVSSIVLAGDQLNNFDDGCGPFNVHLFEVVDDGMAIDELVEKIEIAIKSNKNIKVWNLSINSKYEEAYDGGKITWLGSEMDRIQKENNVVIVQSAGNKEEYLKKVLSPSDATQSLVVNATDGLDSFQPTTYAMEGNSDYFTKKPDLSFFGGDDKNEVNVIKNGGEDGAIGTSLASPFVARKIAHLIYYENRTILEAKTLLIHAAYFNSYNKQTEIQKQKNGWGVLPKHINDVTNTKDDQIRFIFNEKVKDTNTAFVNLKIPQSNIQEYSIIMTYMSSATLDESFGCEYVRSSVNMNMGVLDKENNFISGRNLKKSSDTQISNDIIAKENRLISFYGKWKLTNCLKDIISRTRQGPNFKNYGILAKIDKRINVIRDNIIHNVICVVTLIHKDGINKYQNFLELNQNYINIEQNILRIDGDFDLEGLIE